MKECDVLGGKTYSDPSYIFSVSQGPPNLKDLDPRTHWYPTSCDRHLHGRHMSFGLCIRVFDVIDVKKTLFYVFYPGHVFAFFNVFNVFFYFSNVFLFLKTFIENTIWNHFRNNGKFSLCPCYSTFTNVFIFIFVTFLRFLTFFIFFLERFYIYVRCWPVNIHRGGGGACVVRVQWTAERDMIDTCFICSRSSYDFEHHGRVRLAVYRTSGVYASQWHTWPKSAPISIHGCRVSDSHAHTLWTFGRTLVIFFNS